MREAARYQTLAEECRQLAWTTTTRHTVDALLQMAAEYETKAQALQERGRQRAS